MVECVGVSKCRAGVAVYELSVEGVGGGVGVGCWSASLSVERQSSAQVRFAQLWGGGLEQAHIGQESLYMMSVEL